MFCILVSSSSQFISHIRRYVRENLRSLLKRKEKKNIRAMDQAKFENPGAFKNILTSVK